MRMYVCMMILPTTTRVIIPLFFVLFFFQVVYYCTCTVLYFCISILLLALQLAGTWVGSFCPVGISLFNIYPDTLKFGICTL